MVQGNYNNGSFVVDTTNGVDTLVVYDGDSSTSFNQTALVVQARTPAGLTVSGGSLYANSTGDITPPTLQSAAVNGNTLTLTFSESLDSVRGPQGNEAQVLVNGTANPITNGVISGNTATLTLQNAVLSGQTVTFSYTDPSAANDLYALQDLAGNDIASTPSPVAVTNNTVGGDTTPPTLPSAVVVNNILTLTYNEALDPAHQPSDSFFGISLTNSATGRSINSIAISGSAELGGTLSVIPYAGYAGAAGDGVALLAYASVSGDFASRTYAGSGSWTKIGRAHV